ncbi:hypothetical protein QBC32DRAFT_248195 [Pseudoneurospora amorphoporcata]|uniref:Uncharacterized protein n=1 Tax=Pseudoneurospora amorphoporcata TaxID=241081 RepID=A0AAN6NJV5_9PEZI|nr:hypothetical protein QBC32DRAFT_248195 [Pseudoneurospora amorphoporcata]
MPPKMASNSELSEIKQLLYSLASDLKAVKSDLAELKRSQVQTPESTSTCSSCSAGTSSKPSSVKKGLSNTEDKVVAKVRDTQSEVLQLVEEEKVLILAEVVQLSRAVGKALEDAKGKMMGKVAGITNGKEQGRKRSRSTENMDVDDDLDVAEKRVKQDEQGDTYEYKWGEEDAFTQRRRNCTALDGFVLDTMGRASMAFDCERVGHEWVLLALIAFHGRADFCCIEDWDKFQKEGKIGFEYCLYGLLYHGHEYEGVARGACSCRERHPPGVRQRATRCIRVKRSEDGSGKLKFSWGADIGHGPILGNFE